MKIKNLIAMLALVCGAAFVSSCSNDDNNNQDGPTPTPEQFDLAFTCSGNSSMGDPFVCNLAENEAKLKELFAAKIDEVAGAKNGVVTVTPDTAGDVKEKVKQALIDYAAELQESHKYVGKYEFKFACNLSEFVTVNMNTADEFAFATFDYQASIMDGLEKKPVDNFQEIHTNHITFLQKMVCDLTPFPGFEKEYKDAIIKFSCTNAYGDVIKTKDDNITSSMKMLKFSKNMSIGSECSFTINGGEYTASFDNTFMNYKKDIPFTIYEKANADIHMKEEESAFEVVFTTGYPYNPSDYTKEFNVNVKVVRTSDEQTVKSFDEKITLVTDTSRTKIAATKTLEICKFEELEATHHKIIITSDWEPANNVEYSF